MTVYALGDAVPQLGDGAWVAPDANVIGKVVLEAEASVWFGATLRGDNEEIVIGARSNLQEGVIAHTDPGFPLTIGTGSTVGHGAIIHGCTIGSGVLVGMGATILNGAVIGDGCVVGAGALVTEGKVFEPGSLIVGVPAKVRGPVSEALAAQTTRGVEGYVAKAGVFAQNMKVVG